MVFHTHNAAISVSAVNTHSFSAFVYHHSTFARACHNNCVWRIKPSSGLYFDTPWALHLLIFFLLLLKPIRFMGVRKVLDLFPLRW